MKFKIYISALLAFSLVFALSCVSFASSDDMVNKFITDSTDLKVNYTYISQSEGNNTYIQTGDGYCKNENTVTDAINEENNPPVANLDYTLMSGGSDTGYLTQNTVFACLWAHYNQAGTPVNLCSDPDGDSIVQYQFSGLPKGSILGTVSRGNNSAPIGIAVQISQPGHYALSFRCQDEHGLWSSDYTESFDIYDVNNEPYEAEITKIGYQGLRKYGEGSYYMVRSDSTTYLTQFDGLVKDHSGRPSANYPITLGIKINGAYYHKADGSTLQNGMFYISSYLNNVPLSNWSVSSPDEYGNHYAYVKPSVVIYCGKKAIGEVPFYIMLTNIHL